MKVSVVIPVRDSGSLPLTLQSLAMAARNSPEVKLEVTVVDSSSRPQAIPQEISQSLRIRVIHCDCRLLTARMIGFYHSTGDWVLNLDADQTISPTLLSVVNESTAAAIVFPEISPRADRWSLLVSKVQGRMEEAFRRTPSLKIPVIPRAYKFGLLANAFDAIRRDLGEESLAYLPNQHEDTILFAYFCLINQVSVGEGVDLADVPIYHPIPMLTTTARKTYMYGRDLGESARRIHLSELRLNAKVWSSVKRVDLYKVRDVLNANLDYNFQYFIYYFFRALFYIPGLAIGFCHRRVYPTEEGATASEGPS